MCAKSTPNFGNNGTFAGCFSAHGPISRSLYGQQHLNSRRELYSWQHLGRRRSAIDLPLSNQGGLRFPPAPAYGGGCDPDTLGRGLGTYGAASEEPPAILN